MKIIEGRKITLYKGTHKECPGIEYKSLTGKVVGIYTKSVGPYGTASGIFASCKTTAPFEELRLEVVEPSFLSF